jgi:hypothetical protein
MSASHKNPPKTKTPAWFLERVAQGELSTSQVADLRARLAGEGRSLDDEVAALARSNQEILSQVGKGGALEVIRRRVAEGAAGRARHRSFNRWIGPLVLAGSLGIGLLVLRPEHGPLPTPESTPEEESTRIKGATPSIAPRLLVYRQRGVGAGDGQPERLADGARAARGDLLQLAYAAARDGAYGVLLSIDGAGRVTQHLPEPGASSAAPLRSVREIRLPSAYELDDAPGFERFLLVTATEPFPVSVPLDAARALATDGARSRALPLALAPAFHQTSVLLQKTSKGTP